MNDQAELDAANAELDKVIAAIAVVRERLADENPLRVADAVTKWQIATAFAVTTAD